MTAQILFLGAPLLLVALAQGLCIRFSWLKGLTRPLDCGLRFRGKRLFGDHKTWRGLVLNVGFSTLGVFIQALVQARNGVPSWLFLVDYRTQWLLMGLLMGVGMTAGELPNSFLKRQLEITPGQSAKGLWRGVFFLFDQVDLAMGIWIFIFLLVRPSFSLIAWSFALTVVLHVMVSSAGYLFGMRKTLV